MPHPKQSVAMMVLCLGLAACTSPAGTTPPSAQPTASIATPATTPGTDTPDATSSVLAPPTDGPSSPESSDTPSPSKSLTAAPATTRSRPAFRGEPGGTVLLNGKRIGRDGPASEKALLKAMGAPDQTVQSSACTKQKLKNTAYRWGDVRVTVLRQEDKSNDYGFSYPAGAIAGWRIDPTLDGSAGLAPAVTGPEGTTVGTTLATLRKRFTSATWDQADVDRVAGRKVFAIFVGDTTGATFELDQQDRVSAMFAGYQCS